MNALVTAVEFKNLRIPYVADLVELGIDNITWKVLQETIFPNAGTLDSIVMAITYCRARKLDIMKRPVHIVPMYSTAAKSMIDTVWPSIAELRTTAFRTGQYAGIEAAEFGPMIDRTFKGSRDFRSKPTKTREETIIFPEWCRMTALRELGGRERRFVGPKVMWEEAYARWGDTEVPNEMWSKRIIGQIEKCAEAASLRRAFPEELGNEYAAEEMEGQRVFHDEPASLAPPKPPVPPKPQAAIEHKPAIETERVVEREPVTVELSATATPKPPVPPKAKAAEPAKEPDRVEYIDGEPLIVELQAAVNDARDEPTLNQAWDEIIEPVKGRMMKPDLDEADKIYRKALERIQK